MNERPTPETDGLRSQYGHHFPNWMAEQFYSLARRLEQERNEARELRDQLSDELERCTQTMGMAESHIEELEIRHAAAMLHTQTIVDQCNALAEAARETLLFPYNPASAKLRAALDSLHK